TGDFAGAAEALRKAKVAREMAAEASADIEKVFSAKPPQDRSPIFAGEGEPVGMFRRSEAEVRLEASREAAAAAAAEARRLAEERDAANKMASESAKARAAGERELAEAIKQAEKAEREMKAPKMKGEQAHMD